MKVKITWCYKGSSWYSEYIGSIFEVKESNAYSDIDYVVIGESKAKLLETDSDGTVNYYISEEDCEEVKEMSKFNVGDKVRILEDDIHLGKVGIIVERRTGFAVLYPWLVKFDDGKSEIYRDSEFELVEPQFFDKATALKLAIDGAKVTNEYAHNPKSYLDFDGSNFMWHYGSTNESEIAIGLLNAKRWKLWVEPVQPPKFPVDSFVVEDDGDYWRVLDVQSVDGHYEYYLANNQEDTNGNCHVASEDKLCLPKSTSSQPTSSQNVQGGNI